MKKQKDKHLFWTLIKGAFSIPFVLFMLAFASLLDEDYTAQRINDFLKEIADDLKKDDSF